MGLNKLKRRQLDLCTEIKSFLQWLERFIGCPVDLTFPVKYVLQGASPEKGRATLTNRAKELEYQSYFSR